MTYTITIKEIFEAIMALLALIIVFGFMSYLIREEKIQQAKHRHDRQDYVNQICHAIYSLKNDDSTNSDCICDALVDIADYLEPIARLAIDKDIEDHA